MIERLELLANKYEELTQKLTEPDCMSDTTRYREILKEHAELEEIVMKYHEFSKVKSEIDEAEEILSAIGVDSELRALARDQLRESTKKYEELNIILKELLMPKDPNDSKNVIVEIRGGAGGEEAALFSSVLYRMYSRFAESNGWKVSVMDANETELGGYKEIVFTIEGRGAYSKLKFESGVHRVQRVPETESQGRVHTSTATVAVLPEADDSSYELDMNDVDVDVYRSGGAGGQHINKTSSAIRLTHRPTGIVVTCQDQRSQLMNKEKAIRVLKAKLLDIHNSERESERAETRRNQVGTGDRSERIRTYNYSQNRISDHRIDLTIYDLTDFLDGKMETVIDALIMADRTDRLAQNADFDII